MTHSLSHIWVLYPRVLFICILIIVRAPACGVPTHFPRVNVKHSITVHFLSFSKILFSHYTLYVKGWPANILPLIGLKTIIPRATIYIYIYIFICVHSGAIYYLFLVFYCWEYWLIHSLRRCSRLDLCFWEMWDCLNTLQPRETLVCLLSSNAISMG